MGASSCKLALIRAHYILGEVKQADALLNTAGGHMLFYTDSVQRTASRLKDALPKKPDGKEKK